MEGIRYAVSKQERMLSRAWEERIFSSMVTGTNDREGMARKMGRVSILSVYIEGFICQSPAGGLIIIVGVS
jgi:hypothetical protein